MRFSEYFNEWLYGQYGYYSNFKTIGKKGDFYTAVTTSKFFGGTIAKHIIKIIDDGFLSPDCTILEIGAHQGYLLADIIEFINTLKPELIGTLKFAILEKQIDLQKIQKEYFQEAFGGQIALEVFGSFNEINLSQAFVVSNEIFDAFACELVFTKNDELLLADIQNHKITWQKPDDKISETCKKYKITKGEVLVGLEKFVEQLCKSINKFEFMSFDYGEKYPRNDFSIRIYKDHNVYPFFEENLKLEDFFKTSDITFDVNFAQVIDAFESCEVIIEAYQTQLVSLVEMGILELLQIVLDNAGQSAYLRELNKVKTLINPTAMGERFKMVSFRKKGVAN